MIRGEQLKVLIYRFEHRLPDGRTREVIGLSYAGVREIIRRRGHVWVRDVFVDEAEKQVDGKSVREYRATVIIRDLVNDVEFTGSSTCEMDKPFAYTLAVNKAERNALRKLIPEKLAAILIDETLKRTREGRVVAPTVEELQHVLEPFQDLVEVVDAPMRIEVRQRMRIIPGERYRALIEVLSVYQATWSRDIGTMGEWVISKLQLKP